MRDEQGSEFRGRRLDGGIEQLAATVVIQAAGVWQTGHCVHRALRRLHSGGEVAAALRSNGSPEQGQGDDNEARKRYFFDISIFNKHKGCWFSEPLN